MTRGRLWLVALGLVLAATGFAVGLAVESLRLAPRSERYPLLQEAEDLLRAHYLLELPAETALERGMIRGMLEAVDDPFTVYLEPAAHELMTDTLSGEYGGIGVVLSRDPEGSVILVPIAGGPAAQAGVLEGDTLLSVDEVVITAAWTMDEVGAALRGPEGSTVRLLLAARGPGQDTLQLDIERQVIPLPSATGFLRSERQDIGVIALSGFTERTAEEVSEAYNDLTERGMRALILDLRGNPGGLVDAGVEVAALFLESGTIVVEQLPGGREVVHRTEQPGEAVGVPMAVIADGSTASAAEIVAAALQANGRAPLIGEPTFGKGSVQMIFELADGSSLHITSARWLTPDRIVLDGTGLTPDIRVDVAAGMAGDPFMAAAIDWLDGQTGGPP